MVSVIYVEDAVRDHPRTRRIRARFRRANIVHCNRYGEVFNPRAQNFRLQKKSPSLILARRHEGLVMPTPAEYNISEGSNYYFSHMLNCIYDCRYCFLQGMFNSAHYVLFVNFEDFEDAIASAIRADRGKGPVWFFSGYDCDSLAYEPVTRFAEHFLPVFERHRDARLELRTKSTQVRTLLARVPLGNVVVAFSLTPQAVANWLERGVPALDRRLRAARSLQQAGWPVGLRFDPLIHVDDYRQHYGDLVTRVFSVLDPDGLHSVTVGSFRMPKPFYKQITRLWPEHPLYAAPVDNDRGLVAYRRELRQEMLEYVAGLLLQWVPRSRLHSQETESTEGSEHASYTTAK